MPEPITEEQLATFRRDARITREYVPTGYHVAHRTADAVDVLAGELERLVAEPPALPADTKLVELRAGDRVVLVTSRRLTLEQQARLRGLLERTAPGVIAAVLDDIDTVIVQRVDDGEAPDPTDAEAITAPCTHANWRHFRDGDDGHVKCLDCGKLLRVHYDASVCLRDECTDGHVDLGGGRRA